MGENLLTMSIEQNIEEYLKSEFGQKKLQDYLSFTDVKPKNIYTQETDFIFRYTKELSILIKIFDNFNFPKDIFDQIPEICEFYPYLIDRRLNVQGNKESVHFIFDEINEYCLSINTREYGEYYSNENLINILLDNLQSTISVETKVIDPSSGTGFFLYHYVLRLLQQNPSQEDLMTLKRNLFGYDIFPFPIIISKIIIGKLLEENCLESISLFEFPNIKLKNTLQSLTCISNDTTKFDLIIGNPPYFRIDPHEENNICKCVSFGHNYIHNLFLHWSIQHLNQGGELGLILPQSILSGFYYQKMRHEIMEKMSIDLIVTNKEHEKSFSVQQDIMLFIATKKHQLNTYSIGVSNKKLSKISRYAVSSKIFNNSLEVIPLFKNKSEYDNFKSLSMNPIVKHLSNFKINTGNFVWNQNKSSCFYEKMADSIPLINGPNINLNGIDLNNKRNNTYPYCIPNNSKFIRNETLIVYRRMSPIGNIERMIATIINPQDDRFIEGYVLENHVNFISGSLDLLTELLIFITCKNFNDLINSFCHTNQVSSNDLIIIFELLQNANNE